MMPFYCGRLYYRNCAGVSSYIEAYLLVNISEVQRKISLARAGYQKKKGSYSRWTPRKYVDSDFTWGVVLASYRKLDSNNLCEVVFFA